MSHFQLIIFSIALIVLVFICAFFSCAETALMAVNRYRLRHQARLQKRYAQKILHLLKRPDRLLGVILIGSTFGTILASSLMTLIALHGFGEKGALLSSIVLTVVMLIFAEMAPKTFAAIYPDQVARWIIWPISLILKLFYPVVWLANTMANGLLKLLQVRITQFAIEPLSREELRSVVTETAGKISRPYQNMLLGILDLSKLTIDDVMVPRRDIKGIDLNQPWEKVVHAIVQSQQDWIVVYRDNVDQVIGVLYTRDLAVSLLNKKNLTLEDLQQILHEPYFVPAGTSLYTQLSAFQQSHNKVAFIVDEYGDIQGLLTLNDILEEIIGDFTAGIGQEKRIKSQKDGSYLVNGAITLREFNRATEFELPLSGPKTISGLVIEYLEALPQPGIAVLIAGYPIEILKVDGNRITLAKVFPKLKH